MEAQTTFARLPALRLPAAQTLRSSPPLAMGGLIFCLLGLFAPESDYGASDVPTALLMYLVGAASLGAVSGRSSRAILMDSYGKFVATASLVLLAAMWWASIYGQDAPVWLIDRWKPKDDYNVFENFIAPYVGDAGISLLDGETNAPLHWWANVRLQNAFVATADHILPLGANLLNVCIGGVTAAFITGACHTTTNGWRRDLVPWFGRFVRYCPWLLAASIISIREIWVHCTFAAATFLAISARKLSAKSRLLVCLVTILTTSGMCLLLRPDMVPALVLLVLISAYATGDRARTRLSSRVKIWSAVSVIALAGIIGSFDTVQEKVAEQIAQRAVKYIDFAKDDVGEEANEHGTVLQVTGDNVLTRGLVQTSWLWIRPLPKVFVKPGSVYSLAMVLMPIWMIGFVLLAVRCLRKNGAAARRLWESYRWMILWIIALTILVGFTSAESRHAFNMIPAICVLFAAALSSRPSGDPVMKNALALYWATATAIFLLGLGFTAAYFGWDTVFPKT